MRRLPRVAAVFAAFCMSILPAAAQRWPTQPIMLVNGFPPGGGADILARLVAGKLGDALGQQVAVDNRTGANGLIAAASVASARPDGHTILLYTMSMAATAPVMPGVMLTFDPDKDLAPVVVIAGLDNLLYVSNRTSFRTVRDVIDYAKANPDRLTYGSSGVGSSYQLWAAQFTHMAGVRMLHVPFRGGPPAIAEIIAGRIDMMFGNLAEILPTSAPAPSAPLPSPARRLRRHCLACRPSRSPACPGSAPTTGSASPPLAPRPGRSSSA